jgi:hypothetical protein
MSAPLVVRPRRLTRVCQLLAVLVVGVTAVLAVALGRVPDGAMRFRLPDQIAFFLLGVAIAWLVLRFTRSRVEATDAGVRVRNPFSSTAVPWQVVRAVRMDGNASWAVLELHDDETVPLMAVQSNDGDAAVDAVLELRALLRASRGADRQGPSPS